MPTIAAINETPRANRRMRPDPVQDDAATPGPRRRLLVDRAAALGRTCANEQRLALQAEGRRRPGGWPGTVPEMSA